MSDEDLKKQKMYEEKIAKKLKANMYVICGRKESPARKNMRDLEEFYLDYQRIYGECLIEILKEYDWDGDVIVEYAVKELIQNIHQTMEHIARARRNSRWSRFKRRLKGL